MNRVAILMSTYNGEKYLSEQIDSILAQEGVDATLYIRDDGSSDKTIEIIKNYQKINSNIELDVGLNLGVGNSFMQLVYDVSDDFDYYAFADQDDVWMPKKLKMAIERIKDIAKPALYCSNQIIVDKMLNRIGMRYDANPDITYQQIMCQNKITGCTMLWNKELQTLLSENNRRPSEDLLNKRIHDVWGAMVASVVGEIVYDRNGYILYRQHESNVVGVKKMNIIKQWSGKLLDPSRRNGRSMICRELYEKYKDLIASDGVRKYLEVYGNYVNNNEYKKLLLRDNKLISHSGESLIGFKVKVFLNLF